MEMNYFNNVSPKLREWVNHYWHMSGELDPERLYEILPMDHCDIIVRIEGEFTFLVNGERIVPTDVFFQGMKSNPMLLNQTKYSETIGISFKPWGLFSVIAEPMNNFRDKIVDVEKWNKSLAKELIDFSSSISKGEKLDIKKLENILLRNLKLSEKDIYFIRCIEEYMDSGESIDDFSRNKGISRRKIERDFNKYIGISPSKFNQIQKFEFVSRELLYTETVDLSDLTHEGEYYDQPHFNRQFKKYSKKTPNSFVKDNAALKSMIDFK